MNNTNNTTENDGWTTVGLLKKNKNQVRRKEKKQKYKLEKEKQERAQKQYQEQREKIRYERQDWRRKRIELIKQKELEEYKSRKITKEFSQAIQNERTKVNMTRNELALQLMIPEKLLASYENNIQCPNSHTIVKLRKIFENLPRKYFE